MIQCAQHTFRQGVDHCVVCREPAPWVTGTSQEDLVFRGINRFKTEDGRDRKRAKNARREANLQARAEANRNRKRGG